MIEERREDDIEKWWHAPSDGIEWARLLFNHMRKYRESGRRIVVGTHEAREIGDVVIRFDEGEIYVVRRATRSEFEKHSPLPCDEEAMSQRTAFYWELDFRAK